MFYNLMTSCKSFRSPVPGLTFTSAAQLSLTSLIDTGRLEGDGVGYFASPMFD